MGEIQCPICNSNDTQEFWPQVWQSPDQKVQQCQSCEVFFLHPFRSADAQRDFDASYSEYIAKREAAVEPFTDQSFEEQVEDSIEERFQDIASFFEDAESVLEIGAEKGDFLQLLKGHGVKCTAVDANPEYRNLLEQKGYEAFLYIEDVPVERKFSRVCFFSLLEHIQEPVPFLEKARLHLEPGGSLVFEVPYAREPLIELYDIPAFKSFYFQGMHPYVFSMKSLETILERAGLKIVDVNYKQRYGLSNHLEWLRTGKPGGNKTFEKIFTEIEESYRSKLEQAGISDTIYIKANAQMS